MSNSLDCFFHPRGVVVAGASHDPTKSGYGVARNLVHCGYVGGIHFVNPRGGARGVRAAIIASGRFREVGPEGLALENACLQVAARFGIRLLGPNCIGLHISKASLVAAPARSSHAGSCFRVFRPTTNTTHPRPCGSGRVV